ncbi:MAG: hypothetical protein AAF677_12295, partial [Pseudomonadota bacterium]
MHQPRRRAPLRRALSSFAAACAVLLAAPQAAPAQTVEGVNPCDFSGFDTPCKVFNGEYRAWKPKGEGPFPALVYLYGSGGRADRQYRSDLFRKSVTDRGFVLIVPEALPVVNYITGRDTGWSRAARADSHPRDDIAFLKAVLDHAQDRFRIDRRRVLFAGQSDGGYLIWEIACHHPNMAAAFAVHAGSYGGEVPERCRAPVRFMQAHGRGDGIVPFEAENIWMGRKVGADPLDGLAALAATNGCDARADAVHHIGFQRSVWLGCRRGAALEYWVHEGGHFYPPRWLPLTLDWFGTFDLGRPAVGQRNVRRVGHGLPGGGAGG